MAVLSAAKVTRVRPTMARARSAYLREYLLCTYPHGIKQIGSRYAKCALTTRRQLRTVGSERNIHNAKDSHYSFGIAYGSQSRPYLRTCKTAVLVSEERL
jgi:hypothetical protein